MIQLNIPQESEWIDLVPGFLRVKVKPVGYVEQAAAKAYANRTLGELGGGMDAVNGAGGTIEGLPEDPDRTKALEDLYYAQGLAHRVIEEWEGPVDEDGEPAPVTNENIDVLIRDMPYVGEWFVQRVQAAMYRRLLEGNVSDPSSSGGSAGDGSTADDAEKTTPPAPEGNEE